MAFSQSVVFSLSLLVLCLVSAQGFSVPTGFGSRNSADPGEKLGSSPIQKKVEQRSVEAVPAPVTSRVNSAPPYEPGVEWLRVTFEKAENEVVSLFGRDIPKLEQIATDLVLYEVRLTGALPEGYEKSLRNKLERILLTSKTLRLKDCPSCEQSRLIREADGRLRYEEQNSDPVRPYRLASELGAKHLLFIEVSYTPEDFQLRARLVESSRKEVSWAAEYSTSDVVASREQLVNSGSNSLEQSDALSRVLIGEIAFTTVLAPGVLYMPSINTGSGTSPLFYPSVDLLIGERYDRGRKRFGFIFGAAVNMATGPIRGKPLPFAIRVAPQFRYMFNPYNISSARYSISGELGTVISAGVVTAYIGVGPELTMMQRFSVSLTPMYILPAQVAGSQVLTQQPDGTFQNAPGSDIGKLGGLALMAKGNINW